MRGLQYSKIEAMILSLENLKSWLLVKILKFLMMTKKAFYMLQIILNVLSFSRKLYFFHLNHTRSSSESLSLCKTNRRNRPSTSIQNTSMDLRKCCQRSSIISFLVSSWFASRIFNSDNLPVYLVDRGFSVLWNKKSCQR